VEQVSFEQGSEKTFLKKPAHWGLCILLSFRLYWVFRIFLFEQAVGKLVGLI